MLFLRMRGSSDCDLEYASMQASGIIIGGIPGCHAVGVWLQEVSSVQQLFLSNQVAGRCWGEVDFSAQNANNMAVHEYLLWGYTE